MSVWFIWSKPLGRMGHDMLKWLVNYLSNKLALCLYKGEFRFKVSERKYNMAANENFGHLFDYHKNKKICKSEGNYLLIMLIPWIPKLGKTWWSYETFLILTNYYF